MSGAMRDEWRKDLMIKPLGRRVSLSHSRLTGSRRSFSLATGSRILDKSSVATPRQAVRVWDEDENDVTPLPLHNGESHAGPVRGSRFFLDEISAGFSLDQMTITGSSFSLPLSRSILSSSKFSSQSSIDSVSLEMEEGLSKRDLPFHLPDPQVRKAAVKEEVAEQDLNEWIHVYLSETDTVSLLDLPSRLVSSEADATLAILEKDKKHADRSKSRGRSEKYTDRFSQTQDFPLKHKVIQTDVVNTADSGTYVSSWEMHDSLCAPLEEEEPVQVEKPPQQEKGGGDLLTSSLAEQSPSEGSTTGTESVTSSMKDLEMLEHSVNESDLHVLLNSENFHFSLLVMERSILANIYQPKLAEFRQLPVLPDPGAPAAPAPTDPPQSESPGPSLVHLWSFSCDLTQGRRVNCMVWNKSNPDLLAVGYGDSESSVPPGLVCCWSLKNPTWPERVMRCDSPVTALDFSFKIPSQLAVGMSDGTVLICSVRTHTDTDTTLSSRNCPNKHMHPVQQLRWTLQELSLREDREEVLFSTATDGRVCKWFISKGLECSDLIKLKRVKSAKRRAVGKAAEADLESLVTALTPGLCFDFHPKESSLYLVGTWEGLIHKCSSSNPQQFMDTYKKHSEPVVCVCWSPFCPDVFLSCSLDWSVQLWRVERLVPVLRFTSVQKAVMDIKWSPKRAAVFGVVNEAQLEIWDLLHSTLDPLLVHAAPPGAPLTSLLFTSHTDCALVGDCAGQVSVYLLRGVHGPHGAQADLLEDIIQTELSR